MIPFDISAFNNDGKKERYAVRKIRDFIDSNINNDGNICVLYGLRRTGKTTMMQQAIQNYASHAAFYQIEPSDTMDDVNKTIVDSLDSHKDIICLDEITLASDFIENSAVLPDIFAKEGAKIIVTGTDSLGFMFSEERGLFGRTVKIDTTHIPLAEHNYIFDNTDIDDYIRYGGLMRKGLDEHYVYSYETAVKYLNSAVADNIAGSIDKSDNDGLGLSREQTRTAINKLVELYSGKFNENVLKNFLPRTCVTAMNEDFLPSVHGITSDMINHIVLESRNITRDFAASIDADGTMPQSISERTIDRLKKYLTDMDVLSGIKKNTYSYTENTGWQNSVSEHTYYVIQPAIKYYHLLKAKEEVMNSEYYGGLNARQKRWLSEKLEQQVFGDMTEQIIAFDTSKALEGHYDIIKPVFFKNGRGYGEYDLLISNPKTCRYQLFEIKHRQRYDEAQARHLRDDFLISQMNHEFGELVNKCVLYRGETMETEDSIKYLNISDFCREIERTRNPETVVNNMMWGHERHNVEVTE